MFTVKKQEMSAKNLVWAKMKYCRWWPGAEYTNIPQMKDKKKKFIFFFGSRDFAWIEERNLKPYVEFREEELKKTNMSRHLREAVDRIDEYISDPVKYHENADQEFARKSSAKKAKRTLQTIKKKTTKKVIPTTVISLRYPLRNRPKRVVTILQPEGNRPNEPPILMETVNHFISNDDTSHKYGVLGLGNLGKKIAENLSNSGRCVLVYDTINRLPLPGTITTESANQLISQAKIIFSCISDPINVKNIFFENSSSSSNSLKKFKGKDLVQMVCLDDMIAQKIAKMIEDNGGRYLEALVLLCFKNYAKPSTLAILAAGDRTLLNDYQNCLQSLGDKLFFLGKAGNAAKLYLVLRAISGVITQGLAEGMAFATGLNVSCDKMLEILEATNMWSPMLSLKTLAVMTEDFEVHDSVRDMVTDLKLALALGGKLDHPMPLAATSSEVYKRARRANSQDDSSAVFYQLI